MSDKCINEDYMLSPYKTEFKVIREMDINAMYDWLKTMLSVFKTEQEAMLQYDVMFYYYLRTPKDQIVKDMEKCIKQRKEDKQITCLDELKETSTFPQFLWVVTS